MTQEEKKPFQKSLYPGHHSQGKALKNQKLTGLLIFQPELHRID